MEEATQNTVTEEPNNPGPSTESAGIKIEVPVIDSSSTGPEQRKANQNTKIELFAPVTGPKLYNVKGNNVTPPIIARNLPQAFKFLPIHGRPKSNDHLKEFSLNKIREFVGGALNDDEFVKLARSCSPSHLKTGDEIVMDCNYPSHIPLSATREDIANLDGPGDNLFTVKKLKMRINRDTRNLFTRTLKYRGVRFLPTPTEVTADCDDKNGKPLEPGVDILYRIRVYRPFESTIKDKPQQTTRHSIFNNDIVLLGRQTLTELRDRIVCANDASMRTDLSNNPEAVQTSTAKEMFPSGFLFINNVFYVDERTGCHDTSSPVRAWAVQRKLGTFPKRSLSVRLDQLRVRLGHPDVYIHQGSCEHMFVFSEIRLLGAADPLLESHYPLHTAVAQNQTLYCTTCAEFGARWVVAGCTRIPFDPAFFCDTCLRMYLYRDGLKVCDFKAYQFRGNEINILKPQI
ncbi:uncharacterized protein LOC121729409 isoform X2 [Aricia agestis]|uniref:uncharacterized protein LOC121729409 isoform X2 n=1 Tax=Aricia agestis TaxID=91739 RepID=UPI001C208C46|nr:uncharacterized protein LOC121729409 isoform X2 [Aricia agestis]